MVTIMPELTEPWDSKSRVKKVRDDRDDRHGAGAVGTVLDCKGLATHLDTKETAYGYVVLWDGDTVPTMCFNNGRLALMVN